MYHSLFFTSTSRVMLFMFSSEILSLSNISYRQKRVFQKVSANCILKHNSVSDTNCMPFFYIITHLFSALLTPLHQLHCIRKKYFSLYLLLEMHHLFDLIPKFCLLKVFTCLTSSSFLNFHFLKMSSKDPNTR